MRYLLARFYDMPRIPAHPKTPSAWSADRLLYKNPDLDMTRLRSLPQLVLLAWSLLLAAAAEYLVTLRPRLIDLPAGLEGALGPVWPHPGAVLGAIACFAVAARLFTLAREAQRDCWRSVRVLRNPSGRPVRTVLGGLAVALLLWAWVISRLATDPTEELAPGLFLVALFALLGSLTLHEWNWLRISPMRWRASRSRALEVLLVVALLGLFTFLMTFDLNNWYYSSIGDEHAFFLLAKDMALGTGTRSLFGQNGAYGIIPVLSSSIEGAQMHIFGITGFGWKVATITPVVLALATTYGLARSMFNQRVALLTLGLLATSHYLLGYGHTGYPNMEPILPGVLAPLLFVLGIRRSSVVLLVTAGLVAGLGWYTYYTARSTIVILTAATLLVVKPRSWTATAAPLAVGFGFMVLPLLAVSRLDVIRTMVDQTGGGTTTEAAANRGMLLFWNVGRSLLAFNYNTHDGPWISGSLLEPVAGALFVIGLAWVMARWRDGRSRLLLVWFGIGMAVTGFLSKYDYVSVSRLNFLLPTVCLFSGIAAERVVALLEQRGPGYLSRFVFPSVLVGCTVLAGWGNLQRWFVETPETVPTSPNSVAIRIIEDPRCQTAPAPPLIVDVGIGGAILPALEAASPGVMPEFGLYAAGNSSGWIETAGSRCVIFRAPHDPEAQTLQLALLSRWPDLVGVRECDRSGRVDLMVYYPKLGPVLDQASLPCRSR